MPTPAKNEYTKIMYNKLAAKRLKEPFKTMFFGLRDDKSIPFNKSHPHWLAYQEIVQDFYTKTQQKGIGKIVNRQAYKVLLDFNLIGLNVVEIGPGTLPHRNYLVGEPELYVSVDVRVEFHKMAIAKAKCKTLIVNLDFEDQTINLPDNFADIIITFYSLEHVHKLEKIISEYERILKPNGYFIGAIPNEGGFFWGLGRLVTTRLAMKKYNINYDLIISWEHPNFCDEIRNCLKNKFIEISWKQYPFKFIENYNFNLTSTFVYKKKVLK